MINTKSNSYITSLGTAVPSNKFEQTTICSFMENFTEDDEQRKKIKTVFRASGIRTRHSVLSDYGKVGDFNFYLNQSNQTPVPSTASRMLEYRKHASQLSVDAILDAQNNYFFELGTITHLITVSCTGMYAPGLDVELVAQLPLRSTVSRTCINFMGCFAAISAIKAADAFCLADPKAKVLIVCTELCSLHFQNDFTDDNILANALFADGAAALVVEANQVGKLSVAIKGFFSDILHDGGKEMAWTIGNVGFEMKLSAYVPSVLRQGIQSLVGNLVNRIDISAPNEIGHYAIHPGGKKILDVVAEELGIGKEMLEASYQTLRDFGNMSSPTILFVLKKIILGEKQSTEKGKMILGMAFGPGITIESMLMKVEL